MPTTFFIKIENLSTIAPLAIWSPTDVQLKEEDEIYKYAPFNHLTIFNNSSQDVDVRLYGSNISDKGVEYLPAGSAIIWDKQDDISFTRPYIYNRDTSLTIAANEIILEIRKVVDFINKPFSTLRRVREI